MKLINYMEEAVFNMLDDVLRDMDVCTCERCIHDIAAIALNNLPPKYIATEKGKLYSKIDSLMLQFKVDIISAITKAVNIVKANPRHGENGIIK